MLVKNYNLQCFKYDAADLQCVPGNWNPYYSEWLYYEDEATTFWEGKNKTSSDFNQDLL
jgi:hypothetical protein